MRIRPYVKIARPDHWVKQIFVLPGIVLAFLAVKPDIQSIMVPVILGIISTCFIASANYTINEWLDRDFDQYHPKKKHRPSVNSKVQGKFVYLEYIVLAVIGLIYAWVINIPFFLTAIFLLVMGIIYNVRPLRSKEKVYFDVLSESINNPIRLVLGWFTITSIMLPPSTLLIAYWMGGAFLMAIKRYAEYVSINDKKIAGLYRRSFIYYNRENLILSSFFYALCCVFFLAVFMYKYRIELIISFPFISLLFIWYFSFALSPNSPMDNPEGLYTEKKLILYVLFLTTLIGFLLFINIPELSVLTDNNLLRI